MAQEQGRHEFTRRAFRWRRHRNEVQKHVRAEHDEDQSEQTASDNCCDFHIAFPLCWYVSGEKLQITRFSKRSCRAHDRFDSIRERVGLPPEEGPFQPLSLPSRRRSTLRFQPGWMNWDVRHRTARELRISQPVLPNAIVQSTPRCRLSLAL